MTKRGCLFLVTVFLVLFSQGRANGGWSTEVIDTIGCSGNSGWYVMSSVIDSSGHIHVSYYDETNKDLKYATNATGSWVFQTLDSSGDVGYSNSIAVDSLGHVHISYRDITNGLIKYVTNFVGVWLTQTVDATAGGVSFGGGDNTSIAIDSLNHVHVSYNIPSTNRTLKYATNTTGSWVVQTVDGNGNARYNAMSVDSSGHAHIAYIDATNTEPILKYGTNALGAWATSIIDNSTNLLSYADTSMAIDSSNKIHISYYDYANKYLKYANNTTGTWRLQTSTTPLDGTVGKSSSIKVDSSNHFYISYLVQYNCSSGGCQHKLNFVTNSTGTGVAQTIDSNGMAGMDTSTAIDSSNNVHVIYTSANTAGCTTSSPTRLMHAVPSSCTHTISPNAYGYSSQSTTGRLTITSSSSGCIWTATSNDSWITLSSRSGGIGNGTLTYSISANTTGNNRTGTITIEGKIFTIIQYASGYNLNGDTNNNWNINIDDAIVALQIVAGLSPANVTKNADVNGDSKIGLQEVIYILQKVAALRL